MNVRAAARTLAAAALLGCASMASAAAIPVAPHPGASVSDGRPFFQWALPDGEESRTLYVSTNSAVEADGGFAPSSVVYLNSVGYGATSDEPYRRLPAGDYWWSVRTVNRDTNEELFSTPSNFTVPAALRVGEVSARSYAAINRLSVYVRFTSHAAEAEISVDVRVGARLVASKKQAVRLGSSTSGSARFGWSSFSSISEGSRLTIRVTAASGNESRTVTRHVRAP